MLALKSESKNAAPDTASYIRDMAEELSGLADQEGLAFLSYLLSMVANEARAAAVGGGDPEGAGPHRATG